MEAASLEDLVRFLVAWLVSGAVIYAAVKLYPGRQERESFAACLVAALLGEIVYTAFHLVHLPLASLLALFVWLYVIKKMFNVGWLGAAVIAFLIYVLSAIVGLLGIPKLL